TFREDPARIGSALRCYLLDPRSPTETFGAAAAARDAIKDRIAAALEGRKRVLFLNLLERAQGYARVQADAVFQFQRAWPLFRKAALHVGAALHDKGELDSPSDVFFLTAGEMRRPSAGLRELSRHRHTTWMEQCALTPPSS